MSEHDTGAVPKPDSPEAARNRVICPRCGEVKLETPPGTTVLPTLGMARKAAGAAGDVCECGKRRFDDEASRPR